MIRNFLVHGDIRINERAREIFQKLLKVELLRVLNTQQFEILKKNINAPSLPNETNFNAHKTFKKELFKKLFYNFIKVHLMEFICGIRLIMETAYVWISRLSGSVSSPLIYGVLVYEKTLHH